MGDTTGTYTLSVYEAERTVSQTKREKALALNLRERLEKWKEEKRQNRKKEKLITKEPIHQIQNKTIRRAAANGTAGARSTASGFFHKRRSVAADVASQVNEKGRILSSKPPLVRQSNTSEAKKGLARIAGRTSNKENVVHTKDLTVQFEVTNKLGVCKGESENFQAATAEEEKEAVRNDKEQGALVDTPLSVPRSGDLHEHRQTVSRLLKLSSPCLTTPTLKKKQLTTHHPASDLTACFPVSSVKGETINLQGISLSVGECPPAMQPAGNGQTVLNTELHMGSEPASQPEDTLCKATKIRESSETAKQSNSQSSALHSKAAVNTAAKLGSSKQARFSLSAQFLKPKRQSLPAPAVGAKSQVVPAAKSQSQHSLQPPQFSHLQKPGADKMASKSILKRRSCFGGNVNLVGNANPASTESKERVSDPEAREEGNLQTPGCQDGRPKTDSLQVVTRASTSHVTFASNVETKEENSVFRKTPLIIRRDRRSEDPVRHRLNEWMTSKSGTVKMRHIGCFSCQIPKEKHFLRLQLKPSMTVKQLSEQEDALMEEELRTNLLETFESQGSSDIPMLKPSTHPGSWMHADPSSGVRPSTSSGKLEKHSDAVDAGKVQERQKDSGVAAEQAASKMVAGENVTRDGESTQLPAADESGEELSRSTDSIDLNRLDTDLDKCLAAVKEGLLSKTGALEWLDAVADSFEEMKNCTKWYRCKVAVLKMFGETDRLLETFEEAIINDAKPREELASLLTETMKELVSSQSRQKNGCKSVAAPNIPGSSASKRRLTSHHHVLPQEVQPENIFESTTVKYSVVEVTPFKKRRRLTEINDRLVPVITPVRRSARLMAVQSRAASEGRMQVPGKRTLYSALTEVPKEKKQHMLFQPNQALEPMLGETDDSKQNQQCSP